MKRESENEMLTVIKRAACAAALALIVMGLSQAAGAGAISVTPADGNGVDDDVIENNANNNSGTGRSHLELRSRDISGSTRHRVPFLRFDTSSFPAGDPLSAATLSWYHEAGSSGFDVDVFGVVDGVTGEDNWTAAGLTYNSAPGFSSANYPNPDRNHTAGETTLLGSVSVTGSGTHTLSSNTALVNFLDADTNGVVTFILEAQEAASGEDFYNNISSAENSTVSQRPRLVMIPEASTDRQTFSMTSVSGDPTSTTTVSNGQWATDVTLDDTGSSYGWVAGGLLDPPPGGFIRHGSSADPNTAFFTIDATDPTGGILPVPPPGHTAFLGWELVELSVTFDSTEFRSGDTPNDVTLTDGTLTDSLTNYLESDPAGTLTLTGDYDNPIDLSTFTVVQQGTPGGDSGERLEIIDIGLTFENRAVQEVVIPEPATMCALGLAVAGLGGYVKRRKRS